MRERLGRTFLSRLLASLARRHRPRHGRAGGKVVDQTAFLRQINEQVDSVLRRSDGRNEHSAGDKGRCISGRSGTDKEPVKTYIAEDSMAAPRLMIMFTVLLVSGSLVQGSACWQVAPQSAPE